MMSTLRAEAIKLATLPSVWLASTLAVVFPVLFAVTNAQMLRQALATGQTSGLLSTSTANEGWGQLTFGVVGIVVFGVVAISSEYTQNTQAVDGSRQVSTTMAALPKRLAVLVAKLVLVVLWVLVLGAITIPVTVATTQVLLGPYATPLGPDLMVRFAGVLAYWVVMALLSFMLATLTRSGLVPLAFLLTNASMVSFSLLLAKVTDLARFLPDIAAYSLFLTESPVSQPLATVSAIIVLTIWGAASCGVALCTYVLRDA